MSTARSSSASSKLELLPLVFAVFLCLVSSLGVAHAEESAPIDEAARLHAQGVEHFRAGELEEAIEAFEAAQRLSPSRTNLWNLARCHEQLEQYDRALAQLEAYLADETLPDERRARALEYRSELEAARSAATVEPTPPDETTEDGATPDGDDPAGEENGTPTPAGPTTPVEPQAQHSIAGPWALLASGLALAVTATVLDVVAFTNADRDPSEQFGSYREYLDWRDSYTNMALAGDVLMGVGAAAAIGGLVWLLLWRRANRDAASQPAAADAPPLSLNLTPNGAGASLALQFRGL